MWEQSVPRSDGCADTRAGWGSAHALTLVFLVMLALVPLAYASPPDPLWIAGIYDAADYDDVVCILVDTSTTREGTQAEGVAFPILVGIPPRPPLTAHVLLRSCALRSRAPPIA